MSRVTTGAPYNVRRSYSAKQIVSEVRTCAKRFVDNSVRSSFLFFSGAALQPGLGERARVFVKYVASCLSAKRSSDERC